MPGINILEQDKTHFISSKIPSHVSSKQDSKHMYEFHQVMHNMHVSLPPCGQLGLSQNVFQNKMPN